MVDSNPNIYMAVVYKMKPKVREYIDKLNDEGQIDLDDNGYPYVLNIEPQGANVMCQIVRNGASENFLMNTRSKADPIESWDRNDGFMRRGGKKVIMVTTPQQDGAKPERAKRTLETFTRIVEQILGE